VSTTFPRTRSSKRGYSVNQVEDFLEEARSAYSADAHMPVVISSETIRNIAFELERGGYSPVHVDAALERLEDAFATREKDRAFAAPGGEEKWYGQARETAQVILDRLDRPAGEKFDRTNVLTRGYAPKEVDALAARLVDYFQNGKAMSVEEVRTAAFRSIKHGYSEAQVDLVLDTVITVMLAVR
jgi:DivIVA domain-containing protein